MDRKTILVIATCLLLLLGFNWLSGVIFPPRQVPIRTNELAGASAPGTNTTFGTNFAPATVPTVAETQFVVDTNTPAEELVYTNDLARYSFSSRGGGLQLVQLVKFPESVSPNAQKSSADNFATLNSTNGPPVLAILGAESLQGDGVFKLTRLTNGVHAEKSLANGLLLTKDFEIDGDYLITATVRMRNQSAARLPLPARSLMIGTATPMGLLDNGYAQMVMWYNRAKTATVPLSYFNTNTTVLGFWPRTVQTEYRAGSNDVAWVSAQNQYFTLATFPEEPAPALFARSVTATPPTPAQLAEEPRANRRPGAMVAMLAYPAVTLNPGQEITNRFDFFAGPKEYHTLERVDARFKNNFSQVMNLGFFGVVSRGLLLAMKWMHLSLALNYGVVIILITIVIRGTFWPITQASTRSMKKMQALQPQTKALQEKYKDDPQKLQQKTWELYRKNGVNPLSSCLPMFLQIPVFFGFYAMLRSAIELRGATFLWMTDLSKPDTVFFLPGLGFPVNPMPLIMLTSMLWQARIAPTAPGADPTQQKIMKYMPLFMLIFMYSQPSGLALYWTVSNMLTILQTKLTKTATAPTPTAAVGVGAAPKKKN